MADKWVKRWNVPGSNGNVWRVAIDKDGNYGCSCPRWKFHREECHHILQVKNGNGKPFDAPQKPAYRLAKVQKPVFNQKKNELLVPLIGIPDAMMMEATICYYMIKHGYSMSEVRQMRRIPGQWTAKAIINHVEIHGEAEYPAGWYEH